MKLNPKWSDKKLRTCIKYAELSDNEEIESQEEWDPSGEQHVYVRESGKSRK